LVVGPVPAHGDPAPVDGPVCLVSDNALIGQPPHRAIVPTRGPCLGSHTTAPTRSSLTTTVFASGTTPIRWATSPVTNPRHRLMYLARTHRAPRTWLSCPPSTRNWATGQDDSGKLQCCLVETSMDQASLALRQDAMEDLVEKFSDFSISSPQTQKHTQPFKSY
jgi:hypothetical protein